MSEKKRVTPFPLRLDLELRGRAESKAKDERRSLNAWINIAVEEKLERDQREAA
ncbi:hypothetical protein [Marinobacterium stanieri]|uniref:hypothetical protein n=1 Tax=Marinobacterium stanieri TaxID=49186 RepID=UPI003A90C980